MRFTSQVPTFSGRDAAWERSMLEILLIVLVVMLLFGGGGYYYRGRG